MLLNGKRCGWILLCKEVPPLTADGEADGATQSGLLAAHNACEVVVAEAEVDVLHVACTAIKACVKVADALVEQVALP